MKKIIFLLLMGMLAINATAYDFVVNGIYYNYINGENGCEVEVTHSNTLRDYINYFYTEVAIIPDAVEFNNNTYSVTKIGTSAFAYASKLTSVIIPNTITSIGNGAFYDCEKLTSVTVPNSVTTIGENAFNECKKLTSVTMGNSVTSIGYRAFEDCSGLASFTIPNSLTTIGGRAFYRCSGLTEVTIPNSVTSIGYQAFAGCSGLESITVNNGNSIYDSRNNCNAIIETATKELIAGCKNTIIPNSVTSIGRYAFNECLGLTSIIIPNSVNVIDTYAFAWCRGLTSVTIPNSVWLINSYAFRSCDELSSITIPNSVTTIGYSAFEYCDKLHSVTIGCSVNWIGNKAFSCYNLKEIHSKIINVDDVVLHPLGEAYVFDRVNKRTCILYVPKGTVEDYKQAWEWRDFYSIVEEVDLGDVDGNGVVDGTDLNILINIILGKDSADNYNGRANVDGQGAVDGSDLNVLINIILGK